MSKIKVEKVQGDMWWISCARCATTWGFDYFPAAIWSAQNHATRWHPKRKVCEGCGLVLDSFNECWWCK